jgi:Asp-tRNA(Asn)/Glu-tRNA(Gln) amidotransferase A subunit family amidase
LADHQDITAATIAAAEALLGVRYSEAERALMLDNFAPQIELALCRRAMALPAGLGPAHRFDPRLPGFAMPEATGFLWAPGDQPLPARDDDIAFAPVVELAGWIRSGQLTSERLTRIYLERIARFDPQLYCFATVTAEAALAQAAARDREAAVQNWRGPLHGIPYGMKDIVDTAGVETAWGAEPYRGRVPAEDAHVTAALAEAGAVLLGKTSVGALAYGDIWYGGRTRNPWNLEEGSSGSSAGSAAATAAGLVGFAIGTETLGSIISPSTRCGTVGLRPTHGRVSRRGAMALCWSLDKIGPICRGVADAAAVLDALNIVDPLDEFQIFAPFNYDMNASIAGLRLGYYPADFEDAKTEALERAALDVAKGLGLDMVALRRPDLPYDALMAIVFAEAAAAFESLTLDDRDDELTWQTADAWPNQFRKARFLSAVDHVQLDRLRRLVMREMDAAFRDADVIIGPSLAGPMMVITNFTGHPCLCLPAGMKSSKTRGQVSLSRNHGPLDGPVRNVPHAICLWGRLFDEGPMLAVGRALERHLHPQMPRPPL